MKPGQIVRHDGKHYIAVASDPHKLLGCKGADGKDCCWYRHGEDEACQCPNKFAECFADESVVFQQLPTKKRGDK
jgi:hypothetical protein